MEVNTLMQGTISYGEREWPLKTTAISPLVE
jgi:hypothetical protein